MTTRDDVIELPDGRRVSVPPLITSLIPADDFDDAGLWLPCPCADCDEATQPRDGSSEWYMVHRELWTLAGIDRLDGYLCIGCLERRLGRQLDARDFTGAPINEPRWDDSARLAARKQANQPRAVPEHEQLALLCPSQNEASA